MRGRIAHATIRPDHRLIASRTRIARTSPLRSFILLLPCGARRALYTEREKAALRPPSRRAPGRRYFGGFFTYASPSEVFSFCRLTQYGTTSFANVACESSTFLKNGFFAAFSSITFLAAAMNIGKYSGGVSITCTPCLVLSSVRASALERMR